MTEKRHYQKHEFCDSVGCCGYMLPGDCEKDCSWNAYQFHRWLQDNGFEIVKKEN